MSLEKSTPLVGPPTVFESGAARCGFRRQFWKDNKWNIEWPEVAGDPLLAKQVSLLLVDPNESTDWLHRAKKSSQDLQRIEFTDSIWFENKVYWPKAIYPRALHDMIVRVGKKLDTREWAYVTGTGPWARLAVLTAFDLGYRKLRIISNDSPGILDLATRIQKFCFGIEMEELRHEDVTLQPNNGSLLVNTIDLAVEKDLLSTLLYLNFVRKPALIVDVPFNYQPNPLLQECSQAGFDTISSVNLRGLYDFCLLEQLKVEIGVTWEQYLKAWNESLEALR